MKGWIELMNRRTFCGGLMAPKQWEFGTGKVLTGEKESTKPPTGKQISITCFR